MFDFSLFFYAHFIKKKNYTLLCVSVELIMTLDLTFKSITSPFQKMFLIKEGHISNQQIFINLEVTRVLVTVMMLNK